MLVGFLIWFFLVSFLYSETSYGFICGTIVGWVWLNLRSDPKVSVTSATSPRMRTIFLKCFSSGAQTLDLNNGLVWFERPLLRGYCDLSYKRFEIKTDMWPLPAICTKENEGRSGSCCRKWQSTSFSPSKLVCFLLFCRSCPSPRTRSQLWAPAHQDRPGNTRVIQRKRKRSWESTRGSPLPRRPQHHRHCLWRRRGQWGAWWLNKNLWTHRRWRRRSRGRDRPRRTSSLDRWGGRNEEVSDESAFQEFYKAKQSNYLIIIGLKMLLRPR